MNAPPGAGAATEVVRRLGDLGLTLATAESSTGGLTGHLIVAVPGASRVFLGGVAAYALEPKLEWLRVPEATIIEHGSVSEATALSMARGVREALGVDLGIAETGIASPTDNPERPAGLWCLAVAAPDGYERTERHLFEGDRTTRMHAATERLLAMVVEYLDRDE